MLLKLREIQGIVGVMMKVSDLKEFCEVILKVNKIYIEGETKAK